MIRQRQLDLPYCCYVGDWSSVPFSSRGMVHQHFLLGFHHPREFFSVLLAKLNADVWSNNPLVVACFHFNRVMVCKRDASNRNHARPLTNHPNFDKWRNAMDAGEFWSIVGEDWVLEDAK